MQCAIVLARRDNLQQMNSPAVQRLNNFDALRIAAAFSVLLSHQYALSGLSEPVMFGVTTLGGLGVMVFFSISGFLVSQSWRQDPHLGRFLLKRLLRIWPGLAVFTLIAACILGPITTTLSWRSYFSDPEFWAFFETLKLLRIRYHLPGVFESNIFPKAVNGSLWTIPIEVRCYLVLALLGLIRLTKLPLLVALASGLLGIYYFAFAPDPTDYLVHFGLFFLAGVCLDLFRPYWEARVLPVMVGICLLAALLFQLDAPRIAFLLMISGSSILLGSRTTPVLSRAGRYGDISYGVYVYAFGVQQTVLWFVGKAFPFFAGLLAAMVLTTLCAFASWHWIEHPALRLKNRLRHTDTRKNFRSVKADCLSNPTKEPR